MKPAFGFLVVHGDGTRVVRFRVPRGIAYGVVAVLLVAVGVVGVVSSRYVRLAHESHEVATLRRGAGDRGDLGEALETELASVRAEITAWRALHARMAEAVGASDMAVAAPTPDARPGPWAELDTLAGTVAAEGPRVRALEQAISATGKMVAKLPLRWPVRGRVNSEYGSRPSPWTGRSTPHEGIDIGTPSGTPIESPAPGRVVAASLGAAYGKYVMLDHGNGIRSRYGHLKELDVHAGDHVEKGQVIGLVGSTGRTTGPHLHYEVIVQGKPVDPRGFLLE